MVSSTRYPMEMASLTEGKPQSDFVPEFFLRELRSAARKGEFALVKTLLNDYEAQFAQDDFYAEALSWVARSAASKGFRNEALEFARSSYSLALTFVGEETVVAGSPIALAIGASIEVESQLLLTEERRGEAITFLKQQLERFRSQPFRIRIRKNLHALTLPGQAAPELSWDPLPGSIKGRPTLLEGPCLIVFWAHWCSDSRSQARTIAKLSETPFRDVPVVAPTRLFGYITKGNPVPEAVELDHLLEVRKVDYPMLQSAPIPFGMENFDRYGASTIPTLVGIGHDGIIRFFHAGTMKLEDLVERMEGMLL